MRHCLIARALVATIALSAGTAMAQQIPPLETGPRLVNVSVVDGEIEMRSAATNEPLLMRRGMTLFDARHIPYAIRPQINVQIQPSGFDVIYRFTNTGTESRPLPDLRLGVITLGERLKTHEFRLDGHEVEIDTDTWRVKTFAYPGVMYSPVQVLRSERWAMGVSFHYPVMDYKHDVLCQLRTPSGSLATGEGGRGWEVMHRTSNTTRSPDQVVHPASLSANESRTYVVSVRVTNQPDEWVRTLVPYRNYFHSLYGGVKYQRETTPINAVPLAGGVSANQANPFGFRREDMRPDVHGWGAWAANLRAREWPAVMLWTPSGVYRRNIHMNFPFQFTTNWLSTPAFATATDPSIGLPTVAATGKQLGLWWGRALQVFREWDTPNHEKLDPDNPDHVRMGFAELDLAVAAGATIIGLDTFGHRQTPIWKSTRWLRMMQERAPGVKFITEPLSCDIMHSLTPTYHRGKAEGDFIPDTPEDLDVIVNPHFLADFLLPGHETCASYAFNGHRTFFGIRPTAEMVQESADNLASMGYRPVMFTELRLTREVHAAESWLSTVPSDIRLSAPRNNGQGNNGQGNNGQGNNGQGGQGNNRPPSGGQGNNGQGNNGQGGTTPPRFFTRTELLEAIRRAQGAGRR